jgi:REP element-mobilizing transposase RayT
MPALAYLITFRTYGTWLHGDVRGSVNRKHRAYGTPLVPSRPFLETAERLQLRHPPIVLDARRRRVVADTVREVCMHRSWVLHALAVRTEHVHVVVSVPADSSPEAAMVTLKAWATRRMVEHRLLAQGVRAWSRHGSTRHLWSLGGLEVACRYVLEEQGPPLAEEP